MAIWLHISAARLKHAVFGNLFESFPFSVDTQKVWPNYTKNVAFPFKTNSFSCVMGFFHWNCLKQSKIFVTGAPFSGENSISRSSCLVYLQHLVSFERGTSPLSAMAQTVAIGQEFLSQEFFSSVTVSGTTRFEFRAITRKGGISTPPVPLPKIIFSTRSTTP